MTYDLVIRGGTIVDGSGSEGRAGDLGIENGIITAMGKVDGQGHREIDAQGATVTPRLRRHPHPFRRTDRLGPRLHTGQLARRDHRAAGQLRCDVCALQAE
jgi:predicted amidohydrolase